jgi:cytochrome c oxidase subunit 2
MKKLQGLVARVLSLLIFSSLTFSSFGQDMANGEKIFKANCTACHKLGSVLIGPDLTGVKSRWKDEAKLHAFIKNPQAFATTDPYVKQLVAKANGVVMTPMSLSDQELKDVVAYADAGGGSISADPKKPSSVSYAPIPQSDGFLRWIGLGILILLVIIFIITSRIMKGLYGKDDDRGEKETWKWQNINAIIFPIFFLAWMVFTIYEAIDHKKFYRPEAASDTGAEIDFLFDMTLWITGIVFFVTQILLFWYAWRYRHKEGKKGFYYPHNNTVEFIWTSVPAVVLAGLVLYGFKTWQKAMSSDQKDPLVVEAYAQQFDWTFRYPGPDGKLGKVDFRKIDAGAGNPLGLDWNDPASHDDILVTELHLPLDRDVYMRLRSRDVTHAAYLPHFRMQMYANPGMDNRLPRFKPTITTAKMREITKNPNFNYELACNQLCGAAHYNMRRLVMVDEVPDFQKWLSGQKAAYDNVKKSQTASK